MDPNATLELINDAIQRNDPAIAFSYTMELHQWRLKGGFAPRWTDYPKATRYYFSRYPEEEIKE